MFIDEIEQRYPTRVLRDVKLEHAGFETSFDLPNNGHHVKLSMSISERSGGGLTVYEVVQETGNWKMYFSQGSNYVLDGNTSSIPSLLKGYLQKAIGSFDEHCYEGSFAALILEQANEVKGQYD